MEIVFLKYDGRCQWLENKVLNNLLPKIINTAMDPTKKKMYIVEDWVSNDGGKTGVGTEWLRQMGIPVIKSCQDLPEGNDYSIVNTGYDSIIDDEKLIRDRKIDYIDEPCPYIRKIREIFTNIDENYQYVLLSEPNHIIIKNFKSLYPKDMILVQMSNYQERILYQQNGKPLILVPYVTYLPSQIKRIFNFINKTFPGRKNEVLKTSCLWVSSPVSPVTEIDNMDPKEFENIKDALLIAAPGSTNTSVVSLKETLESKGLHVVIISSLNEFIEYENQNPNCKVLLVRSPIPNNVEKPIMSYIKLGNTFLEPVFS